MASVKKAAKARASAMHAPRKDVDSRRGLIVTETIRIIGERGYRGFSLQELAARCDMTGAGLLYHFGSKEQLLKSVMTEIEKEETRRMAPFAERAAAQIGRGDASIKAVRTLLRAMLEAVSGSADLCRLYVVLLSESLDDANPARAMLIERDNKTIALLAQIVGAVSPQPKVVARQIVAMMDGLLQQWLRNVHAFDLLREWELALEALLPDGGAKPSLRKRPSD